MEQRHNVKHTEKFSSQDNSKWNISVCACECGWIFKQM